MSDSTYFPDILQRAAAAGLPGPEAHRIMAPQYRVVKPFREEDFPGSRKASVLALLYAKNEAVQVVLTRRPDYEGVHSAQISFPGGQSETHDEDHWQTALRETEEEIGVPASNIRHLGDLSPIYIPPSNFFVRPYLGWLDNIPEFHPDPEEVAAVIEMPVLTLLNESAKTTMRIERPDFSAEVPCYRFDEHRIWGATAIILAELEMLLRSVQ
ncbi:MAG TPA: CoA pyrophosphatase [Chitinophagales bacterium]|mgnify:CR=1 FL=1|nr:CoA pyrophosphatase [Chitinophagales bacterium]HRX24313.1 CoA pyrophosphatase [Chitinophagales bacterium]